MPEQNSHNAKAFNPASYTMPAQPSLTFTVIANTNQPELSSYVQTVFHRMSKNSPGATLTDQAPPAIRTTQDMRSVRQDTHSYSGTQTNGFAYQPPVPPIINVDSQYQRSSLRSNLSNQATGSNDAGYARPNPIQSFSPPADHSNLRYVPRTDAGLKQQTDSSASDQQARKKVQEKDTQTPVAKESQTPVAKESQVSIAKTKLVDLRQGTARTETPQRDQNTIAEKPDGFLKRVAFSDKFLVTPRGDQKVEKAKPIGKIIYLKSVTPEAQTAKLKVPKFVQENDRQPVAETEVTQLPEPVAETAVPQPAQSQVVKWPIVDSDHEQVHFPPPVATVTPAPTEVDFVSAATPTDTTTTKIDFTEINSKAVTEPEMAEPETDQTTEATFSPFETTDAPDSPFETTPIKSSPFDSAPAASSPFDSAPAASSPFDSAPAASSPFDSAPAEAPPLESTPVKSSPFDSAPAASSPFDSAPAESSPFDSAPAQSSPFESAPAESSPQESTPFQSSPSSSPFESSDNADLSESKTFVSQSQAKTCPAAMTDFTEASQPVATESALVEKSITLAASPQPSGIGSTVFKPAVNSHSSAFHVASHRSEELKSGSTQTQRSKIILPEFKTSLTSQSSDQHMTASTLQVGHRTDAGSDHQFDMPWLSPWWMLIGLIPIALYVGTVKFFRDEDEYQSQFGSHLNFESDFGEPGKSKSDAIYGRQDEVVTAHGPSGEVVRFDVEAAQSPIEFAESLDLELPSSEEISQCSVGQELRIDQSPNFSQSSHPAKNRKMKPGKKRKKKSKNR